MRRDGPIHVFRIITRLILGHVILIAGCGGSDSSGAVHSEEQARYESVRKLGESNTKQALADAKKKAAQERKEKAGSKPSSPKS